MIRPETDELAMMVSIALHTAPAYTLRNVMVGKGKFDREIAVETLTARVIAALRRYEITREATAAEAMPETMPLFPELSPRGS